MVITHPPDRAGMFRDALNTETSAGKRGEGYRRLDTAGIRGSRFDCSGSDRRSDTLLEFYGFVERWARVL